MELFSCTLVTAESETEATISGGVVGGTVGGVVAVIIILSLTTVIVILLLRSRCGHYSTKQRKYAHCNILNNYLQFCYTFLHVHSTLL